MDCWGATYDADDWHLYCNSDDYDNSGDCDDIIKLTDMFNNIDTIKQAWIMKERKKNRDAYVDKRIKSIIKDARKRYYKKKQNKHRKFK
jgi:hypothetical protein